MGKIEVVFQVGKIGDSYVRLPTAREPAITVMHEKDVKKQKVW